MKKTILVAIKTKKSTEIFSFPTKKHALGFIKDIKKLDKTIQYIIGVKQ